MNEYPQIEEALIAALENDIIAGAALDVQAIEPPSDDSPLYFMRNSYI